MADLRIVDAPVLLQESITDDVKMPTGGLGNFSVRLGDILWYVVTKEQLANKSYVDLSSKGVKDKLDNHIADKANPHQVTKEQVGLGNVDNTADIDKPVSNAVRSAIITATRDMATKTYTKDEIYNKDEIDSKDGDLTTLKTVNKTTLVKAINEVYDSSKGVVDLYAKNIAAGAGANGWDASLVSYGETTQKQINDGFESVAAMLAIQNPRNGMRVYVKSYYAGLNKGGGTFVYDSTKSAINDGGGVINGWVRAEQTYLTPDMFGAKHNDPAFDNTDALNRAFATGRTIYGKKDDVYYVNGILNTKGQQLLGGWKISTSRYNLGVVSTEVEPIDENRIRTIYVGDATDLSELLFIKNMGFNTINFYGGQSNVQQLLDNALAAKLRVNLNTEHGEAASDYVAFIKKYDNHPSVWAYTAYDEPATRGISVAQQDTKIAAMKAVTKKPITMVDLVLNHSPSLQIFSQNYDQVYVDSYSRRASNGDVNKDLEVMRIHYCLVKAMTKCDKVIPVCGLFQFKGAHYTDNVQQILAAAKIFSTVDGGNWGAFVWDGEGDTNITSNIRDNLDFKNFAKEVNKQRDIKKPVTDILLFGGRDTETDWGLSEVFDKIVFKDPKTDPNEPINGFSYPITLKKSTNETSRTTATLPSDVQSISGIGFFGNWAASVLNIKLRKNMRICLRLENTVPSGVTNFALFETTDNGYNNTLLWQDDLQSANVLTYEASIKPKNPDANLVILVREPESTVQQYRKIMLGYIINTDW